jgi:tetratricopeptide (TPR) repeat protein
MNFEDVVRSEVARLIASPGFSQSPVMARLLAFLSEETLAGRGDSLKAYSVAVEGLGKSSDFDPDADSYPRVQVGRLRKLLAAHYAEHPDHRADCLYIPLGAYRVFVGDRRTAYPAMSEAGTPTLAPLHFAGVQPDRGQVSAGLRWLWPWAFVALAALAIAGVMWPQPEKAAATLDTRSPVLVIRAAESRIVSADIKVQRELTEVANAHIADGLRRSWVMRLSLDDADARGPEGRARYVVETQAGPAEGGQIQLFMRVLDRRSDSVIWSGDRILSRDTLEMKAGLAGLISQIASPFGVIAQAERQRLGGVVEPGYPCLLQYGLYYRIREERMKAAVGRCLQEIGSEPKLTPAIESARAIMNYALANDPAQRPQRLRESKALAARALSRDFESADALFANASLAYYAGECARGSEFGERALRANPYNANMFGALGVLIYACDPARSRTMLETARALEPDGPPNFRVPLIVMAVDGDKTLNLDQLLHELDTSAQASRGLRALGRALYEAARGNRADAKTYWTAVVRETPGQFASDDEVLRAYILSDPLRAIARAQLVRAGAMMDITG